MASARFGTLVRHLRRMAGATGNGGLSDAQLLERFVRGRDEAAFEVLLWRHGPMVLGVCRRLLRHEQDAEDAFQATFLALVRKGSTVSRRASVGGWLYRVAFRVALAARASAICRAARPLSEAAEPAAEAVYGLEWRELRPLLDEEVNRLPPRYRVPFVLCHLEGRTNQEAADELGCPVGTLASRLSRARERLRARLVRRGITLSAAGLTAALGRGADAAVPRAWVEAAIRDGLPVAAGKGGAVPAGVAALAEGVLRSLFLSRVKLAAGVLVAVAVLGVGAGTLVRPARAVGQPDALKAEPKSAPGLTLRVAADAPSAELLVAYLNDNARRIQTLECRQLDIECRLGHHPVGVTGQLAYRGPRDFRLTGSIMGNPSVDLGSNDRECWYMFFKAEPKLLFLFSRAELAGGKSHWLFPFPPDWVLDALGVTEYDLKTCTVVARPETVELVRQVVSPRGQRLRLVTVFNRVPSPVQVAGHRLEDAHGKELCSVTIAEVHTDRASGAVLPRRLQFDWPAEKVTLKLKLDDLRVNAPLEGERAAHLFIRPQEKK
jgi:RNA polymerase sigma factor (sigma-70 family)